jgi:hypothetical protein
VENILKGKRKNIMKRVRKVCYFVLLVCLFWVGVAAAGTWDLYVDDATGLEAQIDTQSCNDLNIYLPSDFNHDCYVNFLDFAVFSENWLTCNDPQNPACSPTP